MMKVYLAGGMRSEWREVVKASIPLVEWIDPTTHGLSKPEEYSKWDLHGVKASEVVFAYLEKDNPSGLGMMLEIGYGSGLGRFVIFVDEKNDKYTQIGRETADITFSTLEEGIEFLKVLSRIY